MCVSLSSTSTERGRMPKDTQNDDDNDENYTVQVYVLRQWIFEVGSYIKIMIAFKYSILVVAAVVMRWNY